LPKRAAVRREKHEENSVDRDRPSDTKHLKAGPIGLQYGGGVVKFRIVQIRKF